MKKSFPNILTLLNLLCGILAVIFLESGKASLSVAGFVFIGMLFDFFDGFSARKLKVSGELGKQLDSLADVVTFGLVSGLVMRQLIIDSMSNYSHLGFFWIEVFPNVALLITLSSAYRLAKFNIDDGQSEHFIGLPTPANAIFIVSLLLVKEYQTYYYADILLSSPVFLTALTFLSSWAMNSKVRLLAFKFKSFHFKDNATKYLIIIFSLLLILGFKFLGIALGVILYVLASILAVRD